MRVTRAALFVAPAVAATLVAGAVVAVAAQAQAGPAPGAYYLQSATTGLNAAQSQQAVVQHRPKGNEDHQQWRLRADGDGYRLENADAAGSCLGRAGGTAGMVACPSADALWQVTPAAPTTYTLKDPGADRYLTIATGGDTYADQLQLGAGGDLARWYLTPLTLPKTPVPAGDQRTLDQVTFL